MNTDLRETEMTVLAIMLDDTKGTYKVLSEEALRKLFSQPTNTAPQSKYPTLYDAWRLECPDEWLVVREIRQHPVLGPAFRQELDPWGRHRWDGGENKNLAAVRAQLLNEYLPTDKRFRRGQPYEGAPYHYRLKG